MNCVQDNFEPSYKLLKIMKNKIQLFSITLALFLLVSCQSSTGDSTNTPASGSQSTDGTGQSAVKDDASAKNIVQTAIGSPDHTTLVAAVKAAELVDVLSNTGPFTVFAPTNAAFDKLPKGTLDDLLKPENKEKLATILQYHVSVGVFQADALQDGQTIGQVDGGNITIAKKDGKITVNGSANVVASIQTSNGVIHVIDAVLLPK